MRSSEIPPSGGFSDSEQLPISEAQGFGLPGELGLAITALHLSFPARGTNTSFEKRGGQPQPPTQLQAHAALRRRNGGEAGADGQNRQAVDALNDFFGRMRR